MYKRPPPPANRGKKSKAAPDLGMFGIPDLSNIMGDGEEDDDDVGDDDLEAELHRLLSGADPPKKQSKQPLKPAALNLEDINRMANKVLESDSDDDDSDEKLLNDPALLAELASLAGDEEVASLPSPPPKQAMRPAPAAPVPHSAAPAQSLASSTQAPSLTDVLRERLLNYQQAEKAAKDLGESAKARRFSRAIKNLESLLKTAQAGRNVPEDDIPPPVVVPKAKPAVPQAPASQIDIAIPPQETAPPTIAPPSPPPHPAPRVLAPPSPPQDTAPLQPPALPPRISPPEKPQSAILPPRPAPSLPPPVPPRVESASPQPSTSGAQTVHQPETVRVLEERRDQYRQAALKAKTLGEPKKALTFMKTAKQFDAVLVALKNNQPIDLKNMPPPPPMAYLMTAGPSPVAPVPSPTEPVSTEASPLEQQLDLNEPDDPSLYNAPPPPSSVQDALQQRLEKYRSTLEEAQSSQNSGKARRITRIVKQYEDAIRLHKAGRPVDYESLPCPPGFGPIPMPSSPSATQPPPKAPPQTAPPPPKAPPQPAPKPPAAAPQGPAPTQPPRPPLQHQASKSSSGHSIQEKQLSFLLERQTLFKQAALESKRKGDLEQAKEYLRKSKGLDPMIEASRSGLPIDASTMKPVKDYEALLAISIPKPQQSVTPTIPTPPQIQDQFVVVEAADCTEHSSEEMFRQLERELTHQIEICERNKQHFLKLGDVSSATKFERLALNTAKDLKVVLNLWKRGDPLPRFHYETRDLSIVLSHPDLSSSELEVKVIRGIDLPGKADELDTYVKVELPLPSSETPQRGKTSTVRDTINPDFDQAFKFEINRTRSLVRSFKRCAVKCEVWSKGGFFRGDTLLGTTQIKLVDLEKICTIHDSFDLVLNRRPIGGKLEVQVRIREPLVGKQVEEIKERWLVIG